MNSRGEKGEEAEMVQLKSSGKEVNGDDDEKEPFQEQEHVGNEGGLWKLYCSRALTSWGDRLWQFGLGLMIFQLQKENFTLVATYGLSVSAVDILFGASIGNWIDSTSRLKAAKTFLVIQNTLVVFNCALMSAYFHWRLEVVDWLGDWVPHLVAVLAILMALVSSLASNGSKIVVEKDWIVEISAGDNNKLARLNSIFRTIDLVCLSVTPALAGLLFSIAGYSITAIVIGVWNVVSVVLEYLLLVSIYNQFPSLSIEKTKTTDDESPGFGSKLTGSYQGWLFYFHHPVRNAGLGLSFLYMTVLGLDSITWSYSLIQCVPESVLGLLVGVSAILGILGSISFPPLMRSIGKERSGLVGMLALVSSLSLCVLSVWLPGSPFDPHSVPIETNLTSNGTQWEIDCEEGNTDGTSISVVLTGILLARFGLWLSDLSITQILQEGVQEHKRGIVGGVQNSLNSSFNLIKFILVLIMPHPNMFGILIILSFSSICIGALCLTSYAYKQNKLSCNCSRKPQNDPI